MHKATIILCVKSNVPATAGAFLGFIGGKYGTGNVFKSSHR